VENVLKQHPAVGEVAAVAVPDAVQGSEVKAFVVLRQGYSATRDELLNMTRASLPIYKCPKYIEICSGLPKSATGRILKQVLRQNMAADKTVDSRKDPPPTTQGN
jgi:acyl-coenzyme A synthetase/AMP-(fatty) acid ligase